MCSVLGLFFINSHQFQMDFISSSDTLDYFLKKVPDGEGTKIMPSLFQASIKITSKKHCINHLYL
jgi:hypothetical protein